MKLELTLLARACSSTDHPARNIATTCKLETRLSLLLYHHSVCVEITLEKKVCVCTCVCVQACIPIIILHTYLAIHAYSLCIDSMRILKISCIHSLTHDQIIHEYSYDTCTKCKTN